MAIQITCSQCEKEYRIRDDAAGRSIKCRQCGTRLPVPATKGSTSEDDFVGSLKDAVGLEQQLEALPPRRRTKSALAEKRPSSVLASLSTGKSTRRGLQHVANGINIIRIAVVVRILVFLLTFIPALMPDAMWRTFPIESWQVLSRTGFLAGIAAKLLMLVGLILCLSTTPAKAGGHVSLVFAVMFEIAGACLSGFVGLLSGKVSFLLRVIIGVIGSIMSQAVLVPLLLYMKRLCQFIRFGSGVDDVDQLIVLVGAAIGVPALLGPLMRLPGLEAAISFLAALVQLGLVLTVLVKLLALLTSVRKEL